MNNLIIEYNNVLSDIICDDIIEKFYEDKHIEKNHFIIPKNNKKWEKIEHCLYKQLLISIKKYYNAILNFNTLTSNELCKYLNNNIITNDFIIYSINPFINSINCNSFIKNHSRYNILTYIFYLNDLEDGGITEIEDNIIQPKKGKMIISPFDFKKIIKNTTDKNLYILYGEICYYNN